MGIFGDILGGILGADKAAKDRFQAKTDARNKFEDLRNAAIRGGFNPLTALEATGGAGYGAGSLPSSAPPLASIELLTSAFGGIEAEFNGEAGRARAANKLNMDLTQLKLDQARSGVASYAAPSAAALGNRSPLGKTAVPVNPPMDKVNMFVEVFNPVTGATFRYPNPDLMDSGPSEMGTGIVTLGLAEAGTDLFNKGKSDGLWDASPIKRSTLPPAPVFKQPGRPGHDPEAYWKSQRSKSLFSFW